MTLTWTIAAVVCVIAAGIGLGVIWWNLWDFDELPDTNDEPLQPKSDGKMRGDE